MGVALVDTQALPGWPVNSGMLYAISRPEVLKRFCQSWMRPGQRVQRRLQSLQTVVQISGETSDFAEHLFGQIILGLEEVKYAAQGEAG